MTFIRWIIDSPQDGPTNMARDEALLVRVGCGESPPTLRFYRWEPATISLGYFQEISQFRQLPAPAGKLDVVRRQTGGGAILHDLELTYSLTLPVDHPLLSSRGGPNTLYGHVHDVFALLLQELRVPVTRGPTGSGGCSHGGPFFCFERHSCFDLLVDGRKILGSAQRRTRTAVLQHGSFILDSRFDQQKCATLAEFATDDIRDHLAHLAAGITGDAKIAPEDWDAPELDLAREIRARYAGSEWTARR